VAAELEREPLPAWSSVELAAANLGADFERGAREGRRLTPEDAAAYALTAAPRIAATERSSAPGS
jgi:hypothetical protein